MNQDTLELVVRELLIQDSLRRVEHKLELPQQETTILRWEDEPIKAIERLIEFHDHYEPKIEFTSALTYSAPSTVGINALNYSKPDTFYVHVPSWVKVHRAPFHEFGSNLFGLAYTFTGDVHIREDLQDNQFSEVLFHEVLHQLYPTLLEQQIRSMVLARMGSSAEIHTHVTRP